MKNTKTKIGCRLLSLICVIMMLLASCGGGREDEMTTTSITGDVANTEVTTTEDLYDANGFLKDTIDPSLHYGNKDFNIFIWSEQQTWDFREGEQNGDLINDSVLQRQKTVEERLGVNFVISSMPGSWDVRAGFVRAIENATTAGSKDFDLIAQYTPAASLGATKNLYLDLIDLTEDSGNGGLSLSKPWWPQDIQSSSSIYGKLYFTTGAITPTLVINIGTMIINMDMIEQLKLEDPYELVQNGKWTMDKMIEMTVGTTAGLNPDGRPAYGFNTVSNVDFDDFFYGSGFRYIDPLEDGSIQVSEKLTSEKLIDLYDKCHNYLFDNNDIAYMGINASFASGNTLMFLGYIVDVQNSLRNASFDFEVVPVPKYDEEQEAYYTLANYWSTMYSIPGIANDPECSSYVLEALCSEGYRQLRPAVYENAFQYKYLATEKNAIMYDLICNSLVFDIGRTFADAFNMYNLFRSSGNDGSLTWTTVYNRGLRIWQTSVKKTLDMFD